MQIHACGAALYADETQTQIGLRNKRLDKEIGQGDLTQ